MNDYEPLDIDDEEELEEAPKPKKKGRQTKKKCDMVVTKQGPTKTIEDNFFTVGDSYSTPTPPLDPKPLPQPNIRSAPTERRSSPAAARTNLYLGILTQLKTSRQALSKSDDPKIQRAASKLTESITWLENALREMKVLPAKNPEIRD